jgi:hypothetical protein
MPRATRAVLPGRAGIRRAAGLIAVAGLVAMPLSAAATSAGAATTVRPTAALSPAAAAAAFGSLINIRPRASDETYNLNSGPLPIKAGGHTWDVEVALTTESFGGPGQAIISITTPHLGGDEAHSWTFDDLPAGDLKVNTAKGSATASTGTALSPTVTLKLAFTPASHTKYSCANGGTQTTYTGRLTGTVHLATGLDKLTLNKSGGTFGKPSTVQVGTDFCAPTPCAFASWDAPSAADLVKFPYTLAEGLQEGQPGHLKDYAEVAKLTQLSQAKGILREDGAFSATPAPVFNKSRKTLSAATTSKGAVTGSVSIGSAKDEATDSYSCESGTTSYKETVVTYIGKYTSAKQLEAHTILTGVVKVPLKDAAEFDVVTTLTKK